MTGAEDALFNEKDFRSYQHIAAMTEHLSVPGAGHVAVRSHSEQIAEQLGRFMNQMKEEPDPIAMVRRAI